ncbi:IclR family transcriptional regulator [Streptomyces sp. NPDC051644]|uniref:IclR family transcriptional regulator n=1 Tax=Streptomyces sp. NPDC051644 TaxID=3365666 RepID=UPI003799D4D0
MADADASQRGRRPSQGEPVLDRAFRILAAFGPTAPALSLTSLSVRSGLPKSTTSRIVGKLAELGVLDRTGDGKFAVGLRMLEIASLAPRGHGLRATALPYLEDLHHATQQHVLLAVRDGSTAVLVERLSAHEAGQVLYRVGGRLPLHCTAVGLVLLAYASPELQDEILAGDLALLPENTQIDSRELRTQLADVRRERLAVVSRSQPAPMTSVAAPVFGHEDRVIAALSVVVPSQTTDGALLRPAVVAVARAVTRAIQAHATDSLPPICHSQGHRSPPGLPSGAGA